MISVRFDGVRMNCEEMEVNNQRYLKASESPEIFSIPCAVFHEIHIWLSTITNSFFMYAVSLLFTFHNYMNCLCPSQLYLRVNTVYCSALSSYPLSAFFCAHHFNLCYRIVLNFFLCFFPFLHLYAFKWSTMEKMRMQWVCNYELHCQQNDCNLSRCRSYIIKWWNDR